MRISLAILLLLGAWSYLIRKAMAESQEGTRVDLFVVLDGCVAWGSGARDAKGFWQHARQTWLPETSDETIGVTWWEENTDWIQTAWPDGRCDVKVVLKGTGYDLLAKLMGNVHKRDAGQEATVPDPNALYESQNTLLSFIRHEIKHSWQIYANGLLGGKRSLATEEVPYILVERNSKVHVGGRLDKPRQDRRRSAQENPFDPSLWEPAFKPRPAEMAILASGGHDEEPERQIGADEWIRILSTTPFNKDMMSPPHSDGQYAYPPAYGSCLDDNGVNGISAPLYLIDTGMDVSHIEFKDNLGNPRASVIFNYYPAESSVDGNFHATATGATAAGVTLGTCPGARVFNIKALNNQGSGYTSDIVASVYTCRQHALSNGFKAAVINLSLGGPDSNRADAQSFIDAFTAFENDVNGQVAVAAGNSNSDACSFLPAGVALYAPTNAMVVGAVDQNFLMAPFSNWGSCVTMFAPGVSVPVAIPCPTHDCYFVSSGTSFSCPSVAGIILLHMRTQPGNWNGTTLGKKRDTEKVPRPTMEVQRVNWAALARAYTLQTAAIDLVMGMPAAAYNGGNVFPVITATTYMNVSDIAYLITPAALADPNVVVIPDPPIANTRGGSMGHANVGGPHWAMAVACLVILLFHTLYFGL